MKILGKTFLRALWNITWLTISALGCASLPACAQQTAQQQNIEPNIDMPGNDFRHFALTPQPGSLFGVVATCQLACQRDANCVSWTLVNAGVQEANAVCWLKNAVPTARTNGCCTSGVVTRDTEPGIDRPGLDFKNFDLGAANPNLCRASCVNDERCEAWTYVKPGVQSKNARCWLKKSAPAARTSDCCTSGVVSRPPILH